MTQQQIKQIEDLTRTKAQVIGQGVKFYKDNRIIMIIDTNYRELKFKSGISLKGLIEITKIMGWV